MNSETKPIPPRKAISKRLPLILTVAVHLALLAALFFSVQWKNPKEVAMQVEVFGGGAMDLEAPEVVATPEIKPVEKALEIAPPKIEADITVKEEQDKLNQKMKENKERLDKEKRDKEEARKASEKARLEKLEKDKEQAKQSIKPPAKSTRNFDSEIDNALKKSPTGVDGSKGNVAASTRKTNIDSFATEAGNELGSAAKKSYGDKLANTIRNNIVLPPNIVGNPEITVKIRMGANYQILKIDIIKSSGNAALDQALENAILKSQPLPKVEAPLTFNDVRETTFIYTPNEK